MGFEPMLRKCICIKGVHQCLNSEDYRMKENNEKHIYEKADMCNHLPLRYHSKRGNYLLYRVHV